MKEEAHRVLYADDTSRKIIKNFPLRYIRAYLAALSVSKVLKDNGLKSALKAIEKYALKSKAAAPKDDDVNLIYNARRVAIYHNLIAKLLNKSSNCFDRSVSLAAYLVILGYDITLVVGRARCYANAYFDFHAWVEVNHIPVNDDDGVHEFFCPVFSTPFHSVYSNKEVTIHDEKRIFRS